MSDMIVFIPKRSGPETTEGGFIASGPLRQPVDGPVSQWVSLGEAAINLLAKLESRMNERAITKP